MRTSHKVLLGVLGGGVPLLSDYLTSLILNESAGGVYWPFDDTGAFARAVNPALALGRNLVLNGDFASDTLWTKGAGWTISSGAAHAAAAAAGQLLSQSITGLVIGKTYEVTWTLSNYSAGSVRLLVGSSGTGSTTKSANGTFTETCLCAGSTSLILAPITDFTGDIDNVTVKQVNILASSAFSSAELLADGNMEAVGTGSWTAQNSATISKQTTNPHGGTQVIRVARNGVGSPAASQTILTVGKTYRVTGYCRSDGFASPRVHDSVNTAFSGTTSTSWQPFDVQYIAGTTSFRIAAITTNGTEYCEFDDISITEVNPLTAQVSGALVNQDSGNPRIGKCLSHDGVNDLVNPYSGDLNSVFNPELGTLLVFAKVSAAGVWTDGTLRRVVMFQADASNFVLIGRPITNNTLQIRYTAGGVDSVINATLSATGFFMAALTWDKPGNAMKAYVNGVKSGATQAISGVWAGNFGTTTMGIGASNTSGNQPWSGFLSHPYLVNRAMTAAELLTIAQRAGVA